MAHILVLDLTRSSSSDTVEELIAAINVAESRLVIKALDAASFDEADIRLGR